VPTLDAAQIDAGRLLYGQFCASCHGANLEGQPDWRVPLANGLYPAPPHDDSGHTWHHADDLLMQIVREGGTRNSTAMPGFGAQLSNMEIQSILTYTKSTWGRDEREFQWWVTATQE
jgi:mono/diheme cytochrome c family protein